MASWTCNSANPEDTHAMGRALGQSIGADGLAIALVGPLGAGKTVFVRGLAEGLGVEPRSVSSPTFVIAQQYAVPQGPETLHHVDLYRLEDPEELESIGFYDMFAAGSVLAVEWADRFPGVLGPDHLRVDFEGPSASEGVSRTSSVSVAGPADGLAARIAADWFERLERTERSTSDATGSGPAMHGLLAWLVAAGLLGAMLAESRFSADSDPIATGCSVFEAVPAVADGASVKGTPFTDGFGTLGVRCASSDESLRPVEGVARLLLGKRIDLNEATHAVLMSLPGVGPGRAQAIVRSRFDSPFQSVLDLERVAGIGPKTRSKLEPWLRVKADQGHQDG